MKTMREVRFSPSFHARAGDPSNRLCTPCNDKTGNYKDEGVGCAGLGLWRRRFLANAAHMTILRSWWTNCMMYEPH